MNFDELQIIQKMDAHLRGLGECQKMLEDLRARRLGQTEQSMVPPTKRKGLMAALERFVKISVRASKDMETYYVEGFSNNGGSSELSHFSDVFLKHSPLLQAPNLKGIKVFYEDITGKKALNFDEIRTLLEEQIKPEEKK
jgi:hypothetical protein